MRALVPALLIAVLLAEPASAVPKRRAVRHPAPPVVVPQSSAFTPSKDNTLYESTDGAISNGAGIHLFAGKTASGSRRRAVLTFDLASLIPPGSVVTSVQLTMHVSQTLAGSAPVSLHRLLTDWGEGASNAGESRDGTGAAASSGDATWIHTFFNDRRWSTAGGDFAATADATVSVADGSVTWSSSAALVASVQGWVDQPATNSGWILVGSEGTSGTAKRFDSREIAGEGFRPTLIVEWLPPSP